MTWRPFVIVGLGIIAMLLNGVLVFLEDMPSVTTAAEVTKIIEPLRTLTYSPTNRRQNLEAMGLPSELANLTANHIANLDRDRKKWEAALQADPATLGQSLCPSERVPQPYAMLQYLVYADAQQRYVIEPSRVKTLEVQPWYQQSVVPALYDHFERTERRKADATVMGVAAALLAMEQQALDGAAPWSMGALGAWSYGRLEEQHPKVRKMVIEYFGLMHYLTELANEQRGICS
jgi:hypothetical protein